MLTSTRVERVVLKVVHSASISDLADWLNDHPQAKLVFATNLNEAGLRHGLMLDFEVPDAIANGVERTTP